MTHDRAEVLLVDDSAADVDLMLHALKQRSYIKNVQVARDGEEALNFLFCTGNFEGPACHPLPHLILLDLKLPKVDGLSVLRKIKADRRTRSIPVIVLTSSGEDRDLVATYDLGANSYIQKPVDFDEFRNTVNALGQYWLRVNLAPPHERPSPGVGATE
jgi:two-component system, response regulator